MNKEISLKKFLICLSVFLFIVMIVLYFYITKTRPLCKKDNHPCHAAVCNSCTVKDNKKVCSDCSVFNEKNERVWTGGCIFDR